MTNLNLVIRFWKIIDSGEFTLLTEVLSEKVKVYLPNTRELIDGSTKYIDFNINYPGKWYANIECLYDISDGVISIVKISDKRETSLYVVSVFKIASGLITEIKEYWGENSCIPEWRASKEITEKY